VAFAEFNYKVAKDIVTGTWEAVVRVGEVVSDIGRELGNFGKGMCDAVAGWFGKSC
jgi:hypothetical protein